MWAITYEMNDYNQHGKYLERVFKNKPSIERLNKYGYDGEHLYKGGGRKYTEDVWFYLVELKDGELYNAS